MNKVSSICILNLTACSLHNNLIKQVDREIAYSTYGSYSCLRVVLGGGAICIFRIKHRGPELTNSTCHSFGQMSSSIYSSCDNDAVWGDRRISIKLKLKYGYQMISLDKLNFYKLFHQTLLKSILYL